MRLAILLSVCLLSACSSELARCERHLMPINPAPAHLGDLRGAARGEGASQPAPRSGSESLKAGTAVDVKTQESGAPGVAVKTKGTPPASRGTP